MTEATETSPPEPTRKGVRRVLLLLLLALIALVVVTALSVDDWGRDLSTNRAWTSMDAAGSAEPMVVAGGVLEVEESLQRLCTARTNWTHEGHAAPPEDAKATEGVEGPVLDTHHLVRATRLIGYKDDIWVIVESVDADSVRIHLESRSRVGRGDLGQNPRNLQELLAWLREDLRAD